jgi:hypothetical protein
MVFSVYLLVTLRKEKGATKGYTMRQSERAIFGSGICFFKKKLEPEIGIEPMTCRLRIENTKK